MFISIPKGTLIPSVFIRNFILNLENNHLELDTEQYRNDQPGVNIGIEDDNERINAMYTDLDEEYANASSTEDL